MKALYYGDSIATESVDLIYLDPPFNSKATFNVGLLGESGRDRMRGRTAGGLAKNRLKGMCQYPYPVCQRMLIRRRQQGAVNREISVMRHL